MGLSPVSVMCCQVEISVMGPSLAQRNPTKCGVSECDNEALTSEDSEPLGAVVPYKK